MENTIIITSLSEYIELIQRINIAYLFGGEYFSYKNYRNIKIVLNEYNGLYYRGLKQYYPTYNLPSLYRNKELTLKGSEEYYRLLINELGKSDYSDSTTLSYLISELQHYGAVTRVLDISKNPLIALYFACGESDKEYITISKKQIHINSNNKVEENNNFYVYKKDNIQDIKFNKCQKNYKYVKKKKIEVGFIDCYTEEKVKGLVYFCRKINEDEYICEKVQDNGHVYNYKELDSNNEIIRKFDSGHKVAVKNACSFIKQDIINNFLESMEATNKHKEDEDVKLDKLLKNLDESDTNYKNVMNFMELLNQRAKSNETLSYPVKIYNDLNKAHIVLPAKKTDRIRQQQGYFIYPPFINTKSEVFMNKHNGEINYENIKKYIDEEIQKLQLKGLFEVNSDNTSARRIKLTGSDVFDIIILKDYKNDILKELKSIGIDEGFIYPGIEGMSRNILKEYES